MRVLVSISLTLLILPEVCYAQITATGDYSPTYDGSDPWDMGSNAEIGITGVGSIEVASGSDILSSFAVVGVNSGSTGSVLITGAGSTWTASMRFALFASA